MFYIEPYSLASTHRLVTVMLPPSDCSSTNYAAASSSMVISIQLHSYLE
jgi:hypothetical protein